MLARVFGGLAALTAAGTGAAVYKHQNDEGFRRTVRLWQVAGPAVATYRIVEAKYKLRPPVTEAEKAAADAEWETLDREWAPKVLALLQELKGMYTKYGQIGAGMTNTFSDIWIEKLRTLEDNVPPQPLEVVQQTILEDTGAASMADIFQSFEAEPLGSASIGQVHRAVLNDGREVAVKVQYPDSERLFRGDMKSIRQFITIAAPEQAVALDELERMFESEFDYQTEASNLATVKENLHNAGFDKDVIVPAPMPELCTKRMLVMEYINAPKLVDGVRKYAAQLASAEGKTLEEFEADFKATLDRDGIPPMYEGPSSAEIKLYQQYVGWRDFFYNVPLYLYNGIAGLAGAAKFGYFHTEAPPDSPRIVDVLMRAFGHQLLVDGCFNADPHAGNFLLADDGRIVFIDFGQTKHLTRKERIAAALMYTALMRKDKKRIVEMSRSFGYKSKYFNEDVLFSICNLSYNSFGRDVLQGRNVQQFMDDMFREDPWEEVADNLMMVSFASFRLRGVGMGMNYPIACVNWWGPLAEQVLVEEGVPYDSWTEEKFVEYFADELEGRIATTKG